MADITGFFAFSGAPLFTTPDTRFFLILNNARVLFKKLLASLNKIDGVMLARGQPDIDKTILWRRLLNAPYCLRSRYRVIHLARPRPSERNFFNAMSPAPGLDESTLGILEKGFKKPLQNHAQTGCSLSSSLMKCPGCPMWL